ncbi:MAG: alpha/beta fold hydrolase [Polyangiaceae bacterium]|nr:alpha/beta fold hydrolase [Polyangiaceae bacterium]
MTPASLARLRALYPFTSRFFDRGGGVLQHYVDDGEGDPVVFVHGNPTWSFTFRELIQALRGSHRCVAVDHVGCGLSDKPGDDAYAYTLRTRVDDLEALLAHAKVGGRVTLVAHDWGGAIAMGWATRHPEAVARVVLMNTAAFPVPATKSLPVLIKLARSPLGALLVQRFNAFARGAAVVGMSATRLSPEVRAGLLAPYEGPGDRLATLRFAEDIPLSPSDPAYAPLAEMDARLSLLAGKPRLLVWGAKDFVFDLAILREWQLRWPDADTAVYDDAGHYVLEDAAARVVPRVVEWLAAHPVG